MRAEPVDVVASAGGRRIAGRGTPERVWQAWPRLHALPETAPAALHPGDGRVVVVAPHPDDEVLAFGGLLHLLGHPREGHDPCRFLLIAVTDGDASHPGSQAWPPAALASRRRDESAEGLRRLGLRSAARHALGVPDGTVSAHTARVSASLKWLLRPTDTVLSPWRFDGHPDHDAAAAATAAACAAAGCTHLEAPVWMWHWARPDDPRVPWERLRRVPLTAQARHAKADATRAHASQLETQDTGARPVLAHWALERLLRDAEYVFAPASWP